MDAAMDRKRTPTRQAWDRRLIQGVLENSDLLRGCPPARAATIVAQCWMIEAKRAEQIASKGGRLPGVFAVAYGTVKLALRGGKNGERIVRLAQAGQTFGEASALTGRPAPFDAFAVSACKLLVIPTAAILAYIDCDPRGARQVVLTLGRRVLDLTAELESSSMLSGAQRLAAYLGALAEPSAGGGSCEVRLPVPKAVIAARLDMKKETLSRLLRGLSGRGLITVNGSAITLLDRAKLGEASLP
jgi:CRP-like cAMP-binding protein